MKTIRAGTKTLFATLALGLACIFAFGSTNASASEFRDGHGRIEEHIRVDDRRRDEHIRFEDHDRFHGGLTIGVGERVWVDGCYDNVLEPVLVTPERVEHRLVRGCWQDVRVAAVYENRYVKVWHEGHYR